MSSTIENKNTIRYKFKELDLFNHYDIFLTARKGVRTKTFYDFAAIIKMPEKNLASMINLSARTISNYKEKKKPLEPIYSEHLLKLIDLFNEGEEIFGSIDEFNYWLRKPFWDSTERPIDWLDTPVGVDLVSEEMDKLAQGYPA